VIEFGASTREEFKLFEDNQTLVFKLSRICFHLPLVHELIEFGQLDKLSSQIKFKMLTLAYRYDCKGNMNVLIADNLDFELYVIWQ
jgi:hypothetical protein